MEILLTRHPPIENPFNICYGQFEMPLSNPLDSFITDFLEINKKDQPDFTFSSPSSRCIIPLEESGIIDFQPIDHLKELSFGEWEGKAWNEISMEQLEPWMYNYFFNSPPGGESYQELIIRVQDFLGQYLGLPSIDLTLSISDKKYWIISHAGPIRAILSLIFGISPYEIMNWKIPFGKTWRIKIFSKASPVLFPPPVNP